MTEENIKRCPKCDKEIKRIPKGKHTCRCGEIISSDGNDLTEFYLSQHKDSFRDKRPSGLEIFLYFSIFFVIAAFGLRVYLNYKYRDVETNWIPTLLNIDVGVYNDIILPIITVFFLIIAGWIKFKK